MNTESVLVFPIHTNHDFGYLPQPESTLSGPECTNPEPKIM